MGGLLAVCLDPLLLRVHVGRGEPASGRVLAVEGGYFEAAGEGIAAARAAGILGTGVRTLFFAGGTTGNILARLVEEENLGAEAVAAAAPTRMGWHYLRDTEGGAWWELREESTRIAQPEARDLLDRFRVLLRGASAAVLSGPSPAPAADFLFGEMARDCREGGVPCVLDATGAALGEALGRGPRWVRAERKAWDAVAQARGGEEAALEAALRAGCEGVAVAGGPGEVAVYTEEGRGVFRPPALAPRYEEGCGAAMAGAMGFAAGEGWDFLPAVRLGLAAACASAVRHASGRFEREEVEGFVREVEGP